MDSFCGLFTFHRGEAHGRQLHHALPGVLGHHSVRRHFSRDVRPQTPCPGHANPGSGRPAALCPSPARAAHATRATGGAQVSADRPGGSEERAGRDVCESAVSVPQPLPPALQEPVPTCPPVRLQQDAQGETHTV